jgi:glycosyltransferase involved in cell wall biosynthesis
VDPRNCETVLPDSLIRRREREFLLCDRIVVPSSFAKATFAAEGVGTAETILSGIDADLFRPAESPRVAEPFRVCYSGRLDLGKGVLYLLKAWKQLRLKNAELVLMGEVRREIGGLLPKYAGEDAKIMGFLPRVQAAEQLRRSSLFVFPSLHEGLAQSLLEAMASGVPAIATPNSGAEDCITNGEDGFIVRPRSVEEIAEKIEWCYRNREALGWMGQNARKKVAAKFTIDGYRGRVVNFYERLVSGVTGG